MPITVNAHPFSVSYNSGAVDELLACMKIDFCLGDKTLMLIIVRLQLQDRWSHVALSKAAGQLRNVIGFSVFYGRSGQTSGWGSWVDCSTTLTRIHRRVSSLISSFTSTATMQYCASDAALLQLTVIHVVFVLVKSTYIDAVRGRSAAPRDRRAHHKVNDVNYLPLSTATPPFSNDEVLWQLHSLTSFLFSALPPLTIIMRQTDRHGVSVCLLHIKILLHSYSYAPLWKRHISITDTVD